MDDKGILLHLLSPEPQMEMRHLTTFGPGNI